jgi:putative SOS response-associated peptidase YedK
VFSTKVRLPRFQRHTSTNKTVLGSTEKLYTYTVITTDSNPQLRFLHDRMPVILENGSDDLRKWLDPNRYTWSKELQALLQPFSGELECYPVSQEVGTVAKISPISPISSRNLAPPSQSTCQCTPQKQKLQKLIAD